MTKAALNTGEHIPPKTWRARLSYFLNRLLHPWPHATEGNATAPSPASSGHCWPAVAVISVSLKPCSERQSPSADFQNTVQAALDKFVGVLEAYLEPNPSLETTKQALLYLTPRHDGVSLGQQLVTRAKDQAIPIPEIVTTALKAFEQESPFITEARREEREKEAADAARFLPVPPFDAQQR